MQELIDFTKSLADMPVGGLVTFIILAGFGLAAYAIHAVLAVTKGRR